MNVKGPNYWLRGFTKPRNGSTLQTRQSGNLPFHFGGMTRRSMPPRFKAPCLLWRVFADFAKTSALPDQSFWHLGTFLMCRHLGTLLGLIAGIVVGDVLV